MSFQGTIRVGERLPQAHLKGVGPDGVQDVDLQTFLKGRRVIIFGLPGAFTPLCSEKHVPSFLKHAKSFHQKGISQVICVSLNDVFVLRAWKRDLGTGDDIFFLADGNGEWVKKLGLTFDASAFGLGERAKRFAMVVEDGVCRLLETEKTPDSCDLTGGETVLKRV